MELDFSRLIDLIFVGFGHRGDLEGLKDEFRLLLDRHILGWAFEALFNEFRVIVFKGLADPGELHPDPLFIVVK